MNCACGAPVFIKKTDQCRYCYYRQYRRSNAEARRQAELDRRRTLAAAYNGGATVAELVRETHKCARTVRGWLTSCGVSLRRGRPKSVGVPRPSFKERWLENAWSRMLAKIEVRGPSDCWMWRGLATSVSPKYSPDFKYGRLSGYDPLDSEKSRATYVHRLTWLLNRGPIPKGMTVDHLCFNPLCCNPNHLQLLTRAENSARKSPAAMARYHAPKGTKRQVGA